MQDSSRYAIGIDIGTDKVRCVIGQVNATNGAITVVGVGEAKNTGMRKGNIVKISGPATAIDEAAQKAEKMSGYEVNAASININGSHILSTKTDGMIAVSSQQEVSQEDVDRIQDVATTGKIPANRTVLDIVPYSYKLDGQDGIKDPIGMEGVRLEVDANVISSLTPNFNILEKTAEDASVVPTSIIPSPIAAGKAVLDDTQIENGVAVLDLGGSTTGVAVYEEGDLQYVGVVPIGGNDITNDLAIGLKTDPEVAEMVKLRHATAMKRDEAKTISIKQGSEKYEFETDLIDEIVDARLEEIFEKVRDEFKKAGKNGGLANGVILVGGGSNLKEIEAYARNSLNMAVKKGKPTGFGGVADELAAPEFAVAVGLMLSDVHNDANGSKHFGGHDTKERAGFFEKLFSRFRS